MQFLAIIVLFPLFQVRYIALKIAEKEIKGKNRWCSSQVWLAGAGRSQYYSPAGPCSILDLFAQEHSSVDKTKTDLLFVVHMNTASPPTPRPPSKQASNRFLVG